MSIAPAHQLLHLGHHDHGGISPLRGCWLLLRLRAHRLVNIFSRGFTTKQSSSRPATPGKRRLNLLVALALAPLIIYQAHYLSAKALLGATRSLGPSHLSAFVAIETLILFFTLIFEGISL